MATPNTATPPATVNTTATTSTNPFVWYELMTSDAQAAQAFYTQVVGWSAKDAGMPGMAYTLCSVGTAMVSGMMAITPEMRAMGVKPGWSGYVSVDDVDGYARRVKAEGGAVHQPPEDIPGVGRFAVVADPQGAVFVLFKSNDRAAPTPAARGTPGTIGWHELNAADGAAAFAFYAKLFGWTPTRALDMGPLGSYQMFATGGAEVGGMMTKTSDMPMPCWLYYIWVDAIDAAMVRVTQNGGKVLMGPHEVPGDDWILQCLDPQGAMFALVAPKR
jgi:uncharacterized protein